MVQEAHDAAVAALIARAALGAVLGAVLLLALGLVAELLRRRQRARRVLALLDLTVPIGVRTAIVSLLALVATFTGARPIGAADSVRGWLGQTTPTTMPASPTASTTSPATSATTTSTTSPVVAVLPVMTPAAPTPSASFSAPVAPEAAVGPSVTAPVAATEMYVVQRDDCLWAIAARRLGSRADGRAIDVAWRQIYAANRTAIGDDPNLILIGLTLALPPLNPAP